MKGLRLVQIKSYGFDLDFNRYQLWEHDLMPIQKNKKPFWLPGKIIYHLTTWHEAHEYYNILAPDYDEVDIEIRA